MCPTDLTHLADPVHLSGLIGTTKTHRTESRRGNVLSPIATELQSSIEPIPEALRRSRV